MESKLNNILAIPDITDQIYQKYIIDNKSLIELAKEYSCSTATMTRVLKALQIYKDKDLQTANISKNKDLKYNIDKDTLQAYFDEHTVEDTANYFNIPGHYLYKLINKYDIKYDKHTENMNKVARIAGKTPEEKKAIIAKGFETKFANNSFKQSQEENEIYSQLVSIIGTSDIIRHVNTDSRYPFDCDFYIKSKDLFIEYQGRRFHGPKPYDPVDPICWNEVAYMEAHNTDPTTFTIRDPKKLNIAVQNKINLLLIYPKNDSYLITNGMIKNIGKFDVTKINDLC